MSVGLQDAHAWPELYFEGVGWTRFEPTPNRGTAPDVHAAGHPGTDGSPSRARRPRAGASAAAAAPSASGELHGGGRSRLQRAAAASESPAGRRSRRRTTGSPLAADRCCGGSGRRSPVLAVPLLPMLWRMTSTGPDGCGTLAAPRRTRRPHAGRLAGTDRHGLGLRYRAGRVADAPQGGGADRPARASWSRRPRRPCTGWRTRWSRCCTRRGPGRRRGWPRTSAGCRPACAPRSHRHPPAGPAAAPLGGTGGVGGLGALGIAQVRWATARVTTLIRRPSAERAAADGA